MDHFESIYRNRAAAYERMITAEDADGNLLPAIESIIQLEGKHVLDLGTGTGRLPLMLDGRARKIIGLDLHCAMLRQQDSLRKARGGSWLLLQSDMRAVPLAAHWADLCIAGWAIGHLVGWYPQSWKHEIECILQEMERMTVRGGSLMILETLGTGRVTPAPPAPGLAEYYRWLEESWEFSRVTIATDYQFGSVEEAVAATEFFFGEQLSSTIREHAWSRVPEWTGIWHRSAG